MQQFAPDDLSYFDTASRCDQFEKRLVPGKAGLGIAMTATEDFLRSRLGRLSLVGSLGAEATWPGPLNPRSYIPLYYQLAAVLVERLMSGNWQPGDDFASERELCDEFKVSRSVVRPALLILEREGRIVRTKGRRTLVGPPKEQVSIGGIVRLLTERRDPDIKVDVLEARLEKSRARGTEILDLPGDVALVAAVIRDSNRPLYLCYSFVSIDEVPEATDIVREQSWIEKRDRRKRIATIENEVDIEVSFCSHFEAEQLGLAPGAPILIARCVERLKVEGSPAEIAWIMYRPDAVTLHRPPLEDRGTLA